MKKILYTCLISLFVIIATGTILSYTHQRIPLGLLATPVSTLLSFLTDREIEISGSYYIAFGRWVAISVDNGSIIASDKNGPILSAEIDHFKTTIHLRSLLNKQMVMDGITLQGVELDLHLEEQNYTKARQKNIEDSSYIHPVPFVLQSTGEITLKNISATVFYDDNTIPVQYHVDEGTGIFARETDGHLGISGMVNAVALKANIAAGPLVTLFDQKDAWPFSLKLTHKSIVASVTGGVQIKEEKQDIEASVTLTGNNLDDLVSLFGKTGSKDKAFSAKGKVKLAEQGAMAQLAITAPGTKQLVLSGSVKKDEIQDARYSLKVQGESVDIDVLKKFITPPKNTKVSQGTKKSGSKLGRDDIFLPAKFPVSNLDFDIDLNRLTIADKNIGNFKLKAIVDDGFIDKAPFSATFKTSSLTGHFTFQKEGDLPRIKSRLDSRSFDIGGFLKEFNLAENIDLQIAEVSTDLTTKGRTLGELVDNLKFTTISKDGVFFFEDKNTGARLPIHLHHSTIRASPGNGLQVHLNGEVRNSPIDITAYFGHLRQKSKRLEEVSFSSVITLAGGRLELDGKVPVPIKKDGAMLRSRFSCQQLSGFNDLLGLKLPPIGPVTWAGTLHIVSNGYRLEALQVDVGTSSLTGEIAVDTTPELPELSVNLQAKTIQLNDFKFEKKQPEEILATANRQKRGQKAGDTKKRSLTDQKVLEKYNSKINITVNDVYSGKDRLGSGNLSLTQQGGTLEVKPLHLNLPGGTATLSFSIDPDDETQRYIINMEISELDYGTIGRWYKPDTDLKGSISLRSSLVSNSSTFNDIMTGATGYIDFSIQPEQFRSGVVDLWAVNFFLYLVPYLTPKNESVINCAAARFSVEDGILKDEALLIDTTRIQVKGKVGVDFKKNRIDAIFAPKSKRPQFFSLATPIKINGELSKFKAGVPSGGMVGTVIRNIVSPVTVPLQWIFIKTVPKDGTANCVQLFEERSFDSQNKLMQ